MNKDFCDFCYKEDAKMKMIEVVLYSPKWNTDKRIRKDSCTECYETKKKQIKEIMLNE